MSGRGGVGRRARANATIGRAVRLVCVNLGGARPGDVSMSTLAHPGRYTYCIGEHEEASPWESLAVEHGFASDQSTVALLAADARRGVYAQSSRTPDDLLPTLAASMAVVSHHRMTHWGDTLLVLSPGGGKRARAPHDVFATLAASMAVVSHHRMTHWGDTLLVLSPEHAKILGDAGWKKGEVKRWRDHPLQWPVRELIPGRDAGEGLPEHVRAKYADPDRETTRIPKFRSPEHIKVMV